MYSVQISKKSIQKIEELENRLKQTPTKISRANNRALSKAIPEIEKDIKRRGKPGRFINVKDKPYGQYGRKLTISTDGALRGGSHGRGGKRMYNAKIAANVFLNSEMGKVGRRAFGLPPVVRTNKKGKKTRGRYRISHTSGQWKQGTRLPFARVPQMGPFYFSAKSGGRKVKINTAARKIMIKHLNAEYAKILKRK